MPSAIAATGLVLVLATPAIGQLTFVEVEYDGQNGVDGIGGAEEVVVSPDGRHVIVSGSFDWAFAVFERDASTGALGFVDSVHDFESDGMELIAGVTYSPDGRTIYTAGLGEDKIGVFSFDPTNGDVGFLEVAEEGVGGVVGLVQPIDVVVSPDGANVYVAAIGSESIAVFDRAADGRLTFLQALFDDVGGVDGLGSVLALTFSPDGRHLYAVSPIDRSVALFDRAADGTLVFGDIERDGVGGVDGLDQPHDVAVSTDGAWVVVANHPDGVGTDDWAAVFARDAGTGELSLTAAIPNQVPIGDCTGGPTDPAGRVVFAHEGPTFFAVNAAAGGVFEFLIDHAGVPAMIGVGCDGVGGVEGLFATSGVAISPDDRHVYATGFFDSGVVAFAGTGRLFSDGYETGDTSAWSFATD